MLEQIKGINCCAAKDCASPNLLIKLAVGTSWLRYCSAHACDLLSLPEEERDRQLAADLAACRESWMWVRQGVDAQRLSDPGE